MLVGITEISGNARLTAAVCFECKIANMQNIKIELESVLY